MKRLLLLSTLLLSSLVVAQHHHVAPPIIRGYEHPEQVSDRQAWLMQLIASTSSDSDQDLTKKHAQLHRRSAGLKEFDLTLGEFRNKYDHLVANYNSTISVDHEAGTSAFQQAAWTQLLRDIDQLVDDTVGRLRNGLPPEEWKAVDARVQGVKSMMGVTVPQPADDPSPLSRLSGRSYYDGGPAILPVQEIFDQQSYSGYSTYTAIDTDGTNWIQTVYTMGSANVNGCVFDQYHGQWQPPGCPAQHSFYVTNQLNGSGPSNLHQGTWSYAQYVNLSQSWQAPYQEGVSIESFSGGSISCNIIGTFFAFSLHIYIQGAYTFVKMTPGTENSCFTALGQLYCNYDTVTWCTPETTPPDYNPTGVNTVPKATPNPAYYWLTEALCFASSKGGTLTCFGIANNGIPGSDTVPRAACTKTR